MITAISDQRIASLAVIFNRSALTLPKAAASRLAFISYRYVGSYG